MVSQIRGKNHDCSRAIVRPTSKRPGGRFSIILKESRKRGRLKEERDNVVLKITAQFRRNWFSAGTYVVESSPLPLPGGRVHHMASEFRTISLRGEMTTIGAEAKKWELARGGFISTYSVPFCTSLTHTNHSPLSLFLNTLTDIPRDSHKSLLFLSLFFAVVSAAAAAVKAGSLFPE